MNHSAFIDREIAKAALIRCRHRQIERERVESDRLIRVEQIFEQISLSAENRKSIQRNLRPLTASTARNVTGAVRM